MRAFLLAAFAALSLSMAPGDARAQAQQDFVLVNRTGYTIDEVYVSASNVNSWEEDLMGDDSLENGQQLNVRFARNTSQCMFDIKVVYDDQETAEFRGINLCQVSRVTIFYNRSAGTTRFTTE
ncbi:hypothetical protein [Phreatobacter cathodiphilus]|uniref:Argininosuccinate lyase n=1 Tax=Phreatobacter cathodiphilus TaxID=1868589 RepID=A0A2S0NCB4_9HYPH|nr:hypothetical protein [Phreatobacter cathodiphilus]AVO45824.1 hypothetical protein C6569_12510 [Phreatobacter cathodiphilus]